MIRWIEMVPATFWGVLAGSLFTLLGVWLSNRAQAGRLERQLEHERALKAQERDLALKRDVYLPAAEAVAAGLAAVGRLPDLSVPLEKVLNEWATLSPAIARANLVADDRTLGALTRFHASLSTTIIGLVGVRLRLDKRGAECQATMDEIDKFRSEDRASVALPQQVISDNTTDPVGHAPIRRDFDRRHNRITELLELHEDMSRRLFEDQLHFAKACGQAAVDLGQLTIPLIASARAELALPFDAATYTRIVNEAQASAIVSVEAFFEELRAMTKDA